MTTIFRSRSASTAQGITYRRACLGQRRRGGGAFRRKARRENPEHNLQVGGGFAVLLAYFLIEAARVMSNRVECRQCCSGHKRFEPVSQLHELELPGMRRAL